MGGPQLTLSILKDYYPVVQTLRLYLEDVLKTPAASADTDDRQTFSFSDLHISQELNAFLDESYVAGSPVTKRLQVYPQPMVDMREIIDRSQEILLKSKAPSNIITNGYRLGSERGEQWKKPMSRSGITNYFVNTIVTALQAPEWELLLQCIGDDAMVHLLTETSIFVSLPNDCLCQMTGQHLMHIVANSKRTANVAEQSTKARTSAKRHLPNAPGSGRPSKRLKIDASGGLGKMSQLFKTVKRSPVDALFIRPRLFYSRPTFIPNTQQIIVGLPPNHILNKLSPSYHPQKSGMTPENQPHKQFEGARRLAKYIFPRQYGLASPFLFQVSKWEMYKIPDFVDRDLEIKSLGPCKTPKRLKETLPILEKLIWRHGKCRYKLLRDVSCPSKVAGPSASDTLDSSIILELMSEHLSQVPRSQNSSRTRLSLGSAGNSTLPFSTSQARETRNKPRFAEFCCSHDEVYRYVVLVTKAVIPKSFWGSAANFRTVCRHLRDFIGCRRYETLTLHHVLQGFRTSDCEWLMPPGNGQNQDRVSVSDSLKRRELLEDFIFWFYDSFVVSLLRTTFYVTESAAFRNHVLYFRLDDWELLCAPLIERLTSGTFEKMSQTDAIEILRQRQLGFSFVRLLPKETGVRPIVNLRRKQSSKPGQFSRGEKSINQILQAAFCILSYEKETRPHLLGASIFSADDVYGRLKAFKTRLSSQSSNGSLPKLYFVKMDVQACFDTIEQTKLLEILRELISEDGYMTQRFGQVSSVAGRTRRMYLKKAISDDDHPHFLRYAADLAKSLRHIIFIDQTIYPVSKRQEILELLEQHITDNIVKIGTDYYRQIVGIPQGSILSTILCSFFYGDLERRHENFSNDPQSLMMRLTDDYLFVTTSLNKARAFLDMMNRGHPEYGCFVSRDKTLTNFDYDEQVLNVTLPTQQAFPWCGYLIGMKDLSISVDYSRYGSFSLSDTLTVDHRRRAGVSFLSKMLQLAKTRSHVIYSDSSLNSDHTVHLNIYQNFLLSAMKMHAYLRHWGKARRNSQFIEHTVKQMVIYCYASVRSKAMNRIARANGACVKIQKLDVVWLGTHAFHAVLSRRPHRYTSLLKSLAFELSRPKHRPRLRRFRKLVREGLETLAHIEL